MISIPYFDELKKLSTLMMTSLNKRRLMASNGFSDTEINNYKKGVVRL